MTCASYSESFLPRKQNSAFHHRVPRLCDKNGLWHCTLQCLAASSLCLFDGLFSYNWIDHVLKWNHLLYIWRLAPGAHVGVMIRVWEVVWTVTKLEALFLCFFIYKNRELVYVLWFSHKMEHVGAVEKAFIFLASELNCKLNLFFYCCTSYLAST